MQISGKFLPIFQNISSINTIQNWIGKISEDNVVDKHQKMFYQSNVLVCFKFVFILLTFNYVVLDKLTLLHRISTSFAGRAVHSTFILCDII